MKRAGGIIAIIAGVFGVISAGVTLLVGGLGTAMKAHDASTVVGLGWGGVIFSFATIVLGAVTLSAKGRVQGILLIVCAVLGAILGGTLVAVFMVLAMVGGVLAVVGTKKTTPVGAEAPSEEHPAARPGQSTD